MYELVVLNERNAFQYEHLTYPTFRPCLRTLTHEQSLIAVGFHLHQIPVGLALAHYLPVEVVGEIISLFVTPEHRGQGLGKALLREMESHLRQRNCSKIQLIYIPNSTTPALEKILREHDWNPPKPRMLICTGTREAIQREAIEKAAWFKLNMISNLNYTIFPWVELTAQERQDILARQAQSPWYPDILTPFKDENILEPWNSLGLRYRDRVVGWIITHRITPDTIRYTSLFVKQELQGIGRSLPLLATAIKIHLQHQESHQLIFTVAVDNIPMVNFVQRRLAPYLASIRQSMQSSKSIGV